MDIKKITILFGGVNATSRILGLKSNRYLRRIIADDLQIPPRWIPILKKEAKRKIKELDTFVSCA